MLKPLTADISADKLISMEYGTHIEVLQLSTRTWRALMRRNVIHVEELRKLSPRELIKFRGLGKVGIKEIMDKIATFELNPRPPLNIPQTL